jgi:hypothetical protein
MIIFAHKGEQDEYVPLGIDNDHSFLRSHYRNDPDFTAKLQQHMDNLTSYDQCPATPRQVMRHKLRWSRVSTNLSTICLPKEDCSANEAEEDE